MRQHALYWWIPLILLSVFAYFIQAHLYLHKDVAIIIHTAATMLAGETYTKDIFEPNPPMIFYLSMPAIILAKTLSISIPSAIRIYFIIFAFFSLNLSYFLIKKIVEKNTLLLYLLSYVTAYVLLFLPAQQFAQREHFLLTLILPYLFAAALRLENQHLNPVLAVIIGIMAGIGFSIKPHFFPALALVEIYFIYHKRHFFGWIRVETLCIASVFSTYIAAIFLFYPTYLSNVLPLWMPYYSAVAHPILDVLLHPGLLYCMTVIIAYFMARRVNQYKMISHVFLLALSGFICSYIVPRVTWYHHILPALGIACLLATIIFEQVIAQTLRKKNAILSLWGMASIIYSVPLILSIHYWITAHCYFNADNDLSHLIRFFKQQRSTSSFDLFSMTHDKTILEFYTPVRYIGSFPFFSWEYNQVILKHSPNEKAFDYEKKYIPYAMNIIARDLSVKKPTFIIVDIPSSMDYLGIEINYIEKYSKYKAVKAAWKKYHFLIQIGQYQIYELTENNLNTANLPTCLK